MTARIANRVDGFKMFHGKVTVSRVRRQPAELGKTVTSTSSKG